VKRQQCPERAFNCRPAPSAARTTRIALVLQRHPRLTAAQIRAALIASAVRERGINDYSNDFGFGRVDIARCLELLG